MVNKMDCEDVFGLFEDMGLEEFLKEEKLFFYMGFLVLWVEE